jgi:hypothetical protein
MRARHKDLNIPSDDGISPSFVFWRERSARYKMLNTLIFEDKKAYLE